MLLNSGSSAVIPGLTRRPRLKVLANGAELSGVIEAEVTSTNHYAADRFTASLALNATPWAGASFWASQTDITADVQISLDGGLSFRSIVQGLVDSVEMDPVLRTVRIAGRDLTSVFIEARTQETFSNRTSSEIAQLLAARHGLSADVQQTFTPVGRYYQGEHDRITLDQFSRSTTEWDLLVFLARQEGFDIYVQGQTLGFQPANQQASGAFVLQPSDVVDLRLERALTLARDIEVTVKSWNSRQQNAFTQTARALGPQSSSGPPQRYVFVRPNLTLDQALKLAQQLLAELTRHERVVSITMPGELTLTPRSLLKLQGTGTEFDQTYFVDEIERILHIDGGFMQRLRLKNMNPASQASPPADIVSGVTRQSGGGDGPVS